MSNLEFFKHKSKSIDNAFPKQKKIQNVKFVIFQIIYAVAYGYQYQGAYLDIKSVVDDLIYEKKDTSSKKKKTIGKNEFISFGDETGTVRISTESFRTSIKFYETNEWTDWKKKEQVTTIHDMLATHFKQKDDSLTTFLAYMTSASSITACLYHPYFGGSANMTASKSPDPDALDPADKFEYPDFDKTLYTVDRTKDIIEPSKQKVLTDAELYVLFSTVDQLDKREFDVYFHSVKDQNIKMVENVVETHVVGLRKQVQEKEPLNNKKLEDTFNELYSDAYEYVKHYSTSIVTPKGFILYDQKRFKDVWTRLYWMILQMRHNMLFTRRMNEIIVFDTKTHIIFTIAQRKYDTYMKCMETAKAVILYIQGHQDKLQECKDTTVDIGNFFSDLGKTKFNKISSKNDENMFGGILYNGVLKSCVNRTSAPECIELPLKNDGYLDVLAYAKIVLWVHAFLYIESELIIPNTQTPQFLPDLKNIIDNLKTTNEIFDIANNNWRQQEIRKDVDTTNMVKDMDNVIKQAAEQKRWKQNNQMYKLYEKLRILLNTGEGFLNASEMENNHKGFLVNIKIMHTSASKETKKYAEDFWKDFFLEGEPPTQFFGNDLKTRKPRFVGNEKFIGVPEEEDNYDHFIAKLLYVFLILLGYKDDKPPDFESMDSVNIRDYFDKRDEKIIETIKSTGKAKKDDSSAPSPPSVKPSTVPTPFISLSLPTEEPTFNWNNVNDFKTLTFTYYRKNVINTLNKTDMVNLGVENFKKLRLHKKQALLEILVKKGSMPASPYDLSHKECDAGFANLIGNVDRETMSKNIANRIVVPILAQIDNSKDVMTNMSAKMSIARAGRIFRDKSDLDSLQEAAKSIKEIVRDTLVVPYTKHILQKAMERLEIISTEGKPKIEKDDLWWINDTASLVGRGRKLYIYNPDKMRLVWGNFCVLLAMTLYSKSLYNKDIFIDAYERILDFSDITAFKPPVVDYLDKIGYDLSHLKGVLEEIEHTVLYKNADGNYNQERLGEDIFGIIQENTNKHWGTISKSRGWSKAFKNLNIDSGIKTIGVDPSWDKATQTKYLHCLSIIADVLDALNNERLIEDDMLIRCKAEWPKKKLFKK